MITNERILEIATEKMLDRKANILPTFTCMTNDDEIIAFALTIMQEQMECDAKICTGIHKGWLADDSDAWVCAAAIRNQVRQDEPKELT